jgi:hypothetical protein
VESQNFDIPNSEVVHINWYCHYEGKSIKISWGLFKHHARNTNGGAEIQVHPFLTSVVHEVKQSASSFRSFNHPEITSGSHWTGGWTVPRVSGRNMEEQNSQVLQPAGKSLSH